MSNPPVHQPEAIRQLIDTVHRLRAPGGCPWDRAQTHQSLRQNMTEEAYEVVDVIDEIHSPEDLEKLPVKSAFREELGDVLMQVVLHTEITHETGAFDFYDVATTLNNKLIRRHPHVFGDAKADSADSALQNWEKEKAKEKASNPQASTLDGVPKGLPALQRAGRVIQKVTQVGFQWHDMKGPLAKVDEELAEFKVEVAALEKDKTNPSLHRKLESELGDLLFTLCNVAYLMKISPEDALRGTLARFEGRFKYVEQKLKTLGKLPTDSNLEEMDRYWDEAKVKEKKGEAL